MHCIKMQSHKVLFLQLLLFSYVLCIRHSTSNSVLNEQIYSDDYYEYEYGYEYDGDDNIIGNEGDQIGAPSVPVSETKEEILDNDRPERHHASWGINRRAGKDYSLYVMVEPKFLDFYYMNTTAARTKRREDDFNITKIMNGPESGTETFVAQTVANRPDAMKRKKKLQIEKDKLMGTHVGESDNTAVFMPSQEVVKKLNATVNTTALLNDTCVNETAVKKKKPTFRDILEVKMKEKHEKERVQSLKIPKFLLGPNCESLICGSCKIIVDEFSRTIHAHFRADIPHVDGTFAGLLAEFCSGQQLRINYHDLVPEMCEEKFNNATLKYRATLLQAFESTSDFDTIADLSSILVKQRKSKPPSPPPLTTQAYPFLRLFHDPHEKVCVDVGACETNQLQLQTVANTKEQEQWDDKCFVCQAFAEDLEERAVLTRVVTEESVVGIVKSTCDRLSLEQPYDAVCRLMEDDDLVEDIAWSTKLHWDKVQRRAKGERRFADMLCEEIDFCKRWIEPEVIRMRQVQETVEEVFF